MGLGDQLIATGLAKGAAQRGKKIAFGSEYKKKLVWDHNSERIFRGNPNIVFPGHEFGTDVEWIAYFKGYRGYNTQGAGHWIWNMRWKCIPGEMYFTDEEKEQADQKGKGFVLIEPNVERWKNSADNKSWGASKYEVVAQRLMADGHEVVQFVYNALGGPSAVVRGVRAIETRSFREAVAIMRNASLYVGPEGGLHHAAAAVSIPAVVLFGGFIPPSVTGYNTHVNLTGGAERFCGSFTRCTHCVNAMSMISVDRVYNSAKGFLRGEVQNVRPAEPART